MLAEPPSAHHFAGAAHDARQDGRVAHVAARVGQLDKLRQRVRVERQRELVSGGAPVAHARRHAQVHTERRLKTETGHGSGQTGQRAAAEREEAATSDSWGGLRPATRSGHAGVQYTYAANNT